MGRGPAVNSKLALDRLRAGLRGISGTRYSVPNGHVAFVS
jgi:hypothetical protein